MSTAADTDRHQPNITTPAQKRIINAIHDDLGWLTAQAIANTTGLSLVYVNRHLGELAAAGIIESTIDGAPDNLNGKRRIYSCCGS
jgi:predicted ArsR family transcriptional regulator